MEAKEFYQEGEQAVKALMEEAGIPTVDMLQGLLMSIESNGYKEDRLEKAYEDWQFYYDNPSATNFNSIICFLICKADSDNLFRLSKGFPEHVRVFIEMQLLKDIPEDKIQEIQGENNE